VLDADIEVDRRNFTVRAALRVAPGERLALFGPSGAGKTTVLETIAGLVPPRRARIELAGRLLTAAGTPGIRRVAVPPWQRRVGLLRQEPGLFPHLTVRDNLRYSRRAASDLELTEVAAALGIGDLLSAHPARLSGGQAHRVALGRLLLARCEALLLDEPYTGLDAGLRRTLTELVVRLVADRAVPAILVAHELDQAQAFAGTLMVLDQGAVLQAGTPDEVVLRPASQRVARLVGYGAFVPVSGGLTAGVHPERVVRGDHPDRGIVLTGLVADVLPAGALWQARLDVSGTTVTARLAEPEPAGTKLTVTALDPPLFGSEGTLA